jgi:KDO2-lipid IV(A) lauroyltransferase
MPSIDRRARLQARLLYVLAWCIGRLPLAALRALGGGVGQLAQAMNIREAKVARRNLEIIAPALSGAEREARVGAILRATGRNALETLRIWTRSRAASLRLIREQVGVEHFDAALASGRGLIVAAPHYGNWELLNRWLAMKSPMAFLYAPPESQVGVAFLNIVRADSDSTDRVTQVRAEGAPAVRTLLKLLKDGGVVAILPDQQPKLGDGEFAPFFGRQALTMSLLTRLAARTGATVLFCYCESVRGGFALHVEPAPAAIADPDPQVSVAALNAGVERIARRDPEQYQWTYKRYSLRPKDSGESNPYHPDCY